MTTFGCAIFLANFVLALHSKTYEWRYIILLLIGPLSYFVFYWILNLVQLNDITLLFANNFSISLAFYAIILSLVSTYVVDKAREIFVNFQKVEDNLPGAPKKETQKYNPLN